LLESAVIWLWSHSGGTVTPPVVLQGTAPATVPLSVGGAPAQTADLFDVWPGVVGTGTPYLFVTASGGVQTPLCNLDDGFGNMTAGNNLTCDNILTVVGGSGQGIVCYPNAPIQYNKMTNRVSTGAYTPILGENTFYVNNSAAGTDSWTLPTLLTPFTTSNGMRNRICNATSNRTLAISPQGTSIISIPGSTAVTSSGSLLVPPGYTVEFQCDGNGFDLIYFAPLNGGRPSFPTSSSTLVSQIDASGEVWVAKLGVNQNSMIGAQSGGWARARDVLKIRWYMNSAFNWSSSGVNVSFDSVQFDPMSLKPAGTQTSFTIPIAGIWRFEFKGQYTSGAASQSLNLSVQKGGVDDTNDIRFATATSQAVGPRVTTEFVCAQGDVITFHGISSAAAPAAAVGSTALYFIAEWMGTG